MRGISLTRSLAAAAAMAAFGMLAPAGVMAAVCPPDPTGFDRSLTLEGPQPGASQTSCYAHGTGNINGESTGGNADPILTGKTSPNGNSTITFVGMPITNLVLLDKNDSGGNVLEGAIASPGGNAIGTGTITLANVAGIDGYTNFVLAIKTGNNTNPSWAAWLIPATFPASYAYDIITQGGNSHTMLYGTVGTVIPLPAAAWLLIGGLGGLGLVARRRRTPTA